jgi:WD40 repeat protein
MVGQPTDTNVAEPLGLIPIQKDVQSSSSSLLCVYGAQGAVSLISVVAESSSTSQGLKVVSSFDVNGPLSACETCLGGGFACGGRDNDVKLYDASTKEAVWEGKNVPHDSLRMRVPIWITAVGFMRPEQDSVSGAHIVTGTGHKHVRIYDTLSSRQPVMSIDVGDFRVAAILPRAGSEHAVFVADTSGAILLWDVRSSRRLATLNGCAGSVRSMKSNASGSAVAVVGLDRFLRRFDTTTNRLSSSVYLKNRLNCCLFIDDSTGAASRKRTRTEGSDDECEYDDGGAASDSDESPDFEEGDDEDRIVELHVGDEAGDADDDEEESSEDEMPAQARSKKGGSKKGRGKRS